MIIWRIVITLQSNERGKFHKTVTYIIMNQILVTDRGRNTVIIEKIIISLIEVCDYFFIS